jgi:hypothetical protein
MMSAIVPLLRDFTITCVNGLLGSWCEVQGCTKGRPESGAPRCNGMAE